MQEILHKPLTPAKPILAAETPLSEFGMRRLSTPEVPTLVIRRHLSAALCVFSFTSQVKEDECFQIRYNPCSRADRN